MINNINSYIDNSLNIINILRVLLIVNATAKGWDIKKISDKQFELTKKYDSNLDNSLNLTEFINSLIILT